MTGFLWAFAVGAVIILVFWLTMSKSDTAQLVLAYMNINQLPMLDDTAERHVYQMLIVPLERAGAIVSSDEGGTRHLVFTDAISKARVHVKIEHSSTIVMLTSGRHKHHHVILTYTFTHEESLPEGVRMYTDVHDGSKPPAHEVLWEDPTSPRSPLRTSFPQGLLMCVSDAQGFDDVFDVLAHEQRGEVSALVSVRREGHDLTCVYSGSISGVFDGHHIDYLMQQQLEHALLIARTCSGWNGQRMGLIERAVEMVCAPRRQSTATSRSLGARVLCHLHDYPFMANTEQAARLRARLYDANLEWDYT